MLAKKARLPVQLVIRKRGRLTHTEHFLISAHPSKLTYGRIGVVISKKVAPKATLRNLLRRAVYTFFLKNPKQIRPSTDLVISIKKLPKKATKGDMINVLIKELTSL